MKALPKKFLLGLGIGTTATVVALLLRRRRMPQPFVRTTQDLTYSAMPAQTLEANKLADVNIARLEDLVGLGLEPQAAERLIENRPFRHKLELLSRKVVSPDVYEIIKDKVAVANANESIKVA